MPPQFFGTDPDGFREFFSGSNIKHSRVTSLWQNILTTYFTTGNGFLFEPEYEFSDGKKADGCLLLRPTRIAKPVVTIVESKPTNSGESLTSAMSQAYNYAKNLKRAKKTLVVVAKGTKFIMFSVPGSQMDPTWEWADLGNKKNGDPYDVFDDCYAVERVLLALRPAILNGDYTE